MYESFGKREKEREREEFPFSIKSPPIQAPPPPPLAAVLPPTLQNFGLPAHLEVGHGDGPAEADGGVTKHVGANLSVPEVVVEVVGHGGEGHARSLGDDGRDGRHGCLIYNDITLGK